MRIDTRVPPGTTFGGDWHNVLDAVFGPLDESSARGPYGFVSTEFAALTRGQQAVFNLRWLRDCVEADTFLEYWNEPGLRDHAHRLVEDARLTGAEMFASVIGQMVALAGDEPPKPPFDESYMSAVGQLEQELLAIEKQHGQLWEVLAAYVRSAPHEFVRQS